MSVSGNCNIIGRPIAATGVRDIDFTSRPDNEANVLYATPDDIHYELEPALEVGEDDD